MNPEDKSGGVATLPPPAAGVATLEAPVPMGVASHHASPVMQGFDPMARAMSVAPFYSTQYLNGIAALAKQAVTSKLYGDLNESQAVMILQTGMEMGLAPTVALRNIGAFKGKTTTAAQLMLAMVKAAGYQERIIESTDKAAEISIQKPGREAFVSRFTIEDAVKAGLLERNALYKTMPKPMLLSRAIAHACRYGAPEVGAGLYTPEEVMDIQELSPEAPKAPAPPAAVIPPEKGGAPAGSTTKKPPVKPEASAQPAPGAAALPSTWTDTRKSWVKARMTELDATEEVITSTLAVLDKEGVSEESRVAFCDFLKKGDLPAAGAVVLGLAQPTEGAPQD